VLSAEEVRALITPAEAFAACRDAFVRLARGEVVLPDVMSFDLTDRHGEVHAKGAHIQGTPYFSIKVAAGFYDNPQRGLPAGSGSVWVFDANTGYQVALLLDNGFLTDLRTGVSGGLAADALSNSTVRQVAVLGCGVQGRRQLEALLHVRRPQLVVAFSRRRDVAEQYAREMSDALGVTVTAASSAEEAVRGSDLIITSTPSREPIVADDWVMAGAHITAVGSDMPDKVELDPALLGRAVVVADRLAQCVTQGEIHHAINAGTITADDVRAELGEVLAGTKPGRTDPDEITIADLTGIGALDAAVANLVTEKALAAGAGRALAVEG
jgi:ornithine cyclodeaminase